MLGLFESARTLARVSLAAGDWDTAMHAAGDAVRSVRNTGSNAIWSADAAALMNIILFRRWQAKGDRADLAAVETWLRGGQVVEKLRNWETRRIAGFHCDASLLIAARVMIENGRFDDCEALPDEILRHAVRTQRLLAQAETLIVRALLEARRGRFDAAAQSMQRALELAAPARAVRLFVDEGPAVQPLIERAAASLAGKDFAQLVLASFAAAPRLPPRPSAPEGLSEREVEVLRLIASGASNQEAGRKLFIAASTVKKHLENIYAKLAWAGGWRRLRGRARWACCNLQITEVGHAGGWYGWLFLSGQRSQGVEGLVQGASRRRRRLRHRCERASERMGLVHPGRADGVRAVQAVQRLFPGREADDDQPPRHRSGRPARQPARRRDRGHHQGRMELARNRPLRPYPRPGGEPDRALGAGFLTRGPGENTPNGECGYAGRAPNLRAVCRPMTTARADPLHRRYHRARRAPQRSAAGVDSGHQRLPRLPGGQRLSRVAAARRRSPFRRPSASLPSSGRSSRGPS